MGKKFIRVVAMSMVLVIMSAVVIIIVYRSARNAKKGTSRHKLLHPEWYDLLQFPEKQFPPLDSAYDEYRSMVNQGYKVARKSTVVITGLARDIESNIGKNLDWLVALGSNFKDFKVVVFENDSSDLTQDIIKAKSRLHSNINLMECKEALSCKMKERKVVENGILSNTCFEKMAQFRNRSLDHIRYKYSKYNYLMVVDLNLAGPISADSMVNCLAYKKWDAMSTVGLVNHSFTNAETLLYYDSIAFVPFRNAPQKGNHLNTLIHTVNTFKMKVPKREALPIRITSGFAGCSLYRLALLVANPNICYSGQFCKHVDFHMSMATQGLDKIYVNPAFLLLHTITVSGKSKNLMEKVLFS